MHNLYTFKWHGQSSFVRVVALHLCSFRSMLQIGRAVQGPLVQELVYSAHSTRIHDLALPHKCSQLVASCSDGEIRLWNTERQKELVRIEQPSVDCLCLTISKVMSIQVFH